MSETRYARIINEETQEVQVGVGCPVEYYVEIGMVEMEVEQAYNSNWYVAGHAPEKPAEPEPTELEKKQQELWETEQKLRDLDYIGVKIATGRATIEEYTEEIAEMSRLADKVNQLRAEIKELENEKLD